ncbi:response regulator transcription factor [Reyranella sp.]|uniref:response regulator transcription factor n=1 Tax=Reyranella sp. TaxID=1929291 RepID=UPI003D0DA7CF
MKQGSTTVVIEPRSLVREALISLLTGHSYQVVGNFGSTAGMDKSLPAPGLVVLGALPVEEAASAAGSIRARWAKAKIVLLFERASAADIQKLLASEIDGCIPLSASPDALIGTLQQITQSGHRIVVLQTGPLAIARSTGGQEKFDEPAVAHNYAAPADVAQNGPIDRKTSVSIVHGLSQREEQVLKSVVRGHSNKMIARTCGVTDSTIKVHMKSILRKIRVENRTQAAIWALERGYGVESTQQVKAAA